jgi:hypothetical protein
MRCDIASVEGILDALSQPLVLSAVREWTREERQALAEPILRQLQRASKMALSLEARNKGPVVVTRVTAPKPGDGPHLSRGCHQTCETGRHAWAPADTIAALQRHSEHMEAPAETVI